VFSVTVVLYGILAYFKFETTDADSAGMMRLLDYVVMKAPVAVSSMSKSISTPSERDGCGLVVR
jgi:hypothetical protein